MDDGSRQEDDGCGTYLLEAGFWVNLLYLLSSYWVLLFIIVAWVILVVLKEIGLQTGILLLLMLIWVHALYMHSEHDIHGVAFLLQSFFYIIHIHIDWISRLPKDILFKYFCPISILESPIYSSN